MLLERRSCDIRQKLIQCRLEKKTIVLPSIFSPSGWKQVYHLCPRGSREDIPAAESLGWGWAETWKDSVALMGSIWNPQLNPNNPGANQTWIRSNTLRHRRTASHTLTEQNILATLIWGCCNILILYEQIYLYSHLSQHGHRWACENGIGPTGKYGALVHLGNSWGRNKAEISHVVTLISPFIYFHLPDSCCSHHKLFPCIKHLNFIFNYSHSE